MTPDEDAHLEEEPTLGERLRRERLRRGISPRDAARLLRTTERTLRRWETSDVAKSKRLLAEDFISSRDVSAAVPSLPEASNLELVEELLRRLNRADHRSSPSDPAEFQLDDPGSTGSTSAQ